MSPKNLSENPTPSHTELPDEEAIIARLEQFRPTPSSRFYQRMAAAPWSVGQVESKKTGLSWWRRAVLAAPVLIALIIVLLALFSPPSLRATAQRFAQFFIRSTTNQTSVVITPGSDGRLDYNFDQTILEAQEAAGFPVRAPVSVPGGLQFSGAIFISDLDTVFLDYRSEDSRQILRISIQNLDGRETYASIGENADVEAIQIGEVTGEYVAGGWKLPAVATPLEAAAPGVTITLEAAWESEGQTEILRWQKGDLLYEILSVTAPSVRDRALTKAELISLAEEMQP